MPGERETKATDRVGELLDVERLLLDITAGIDNRELDMLCAMRHRVQAARVVIGIVRRETEEKDYA